MKRFTTIIGLLFLSLNVSATDRTELVNKCKAVGPFSRYIPYVCEGKNKRAEPNIVCVKSDLLLAEATRFYFHIINEATERVETMKFFPADKFRPENGRLLSSYKEKATWNHDPSFQFSKVDIDLTSDDDDVYTGSLTYKRQMHIPPVERIKLRRLTCYRNDEIAQN